MSKIDVGDRRVATASVRSWDGATAVTAAKISKILTSTLDLTQTRERIVSATLVLTGARRATLFEHDAASGTLVCVAAGGDGDRSPWIGQRLGPGIGVAGLAWAQAGPVWSSDLLADARFRLPEWLVDRILSEGHRSAMGAPLIARGNVVGALCAGDLPGRAFAADEVRRLSLVAGQAVVALEQARLHHDTEERLRRTEQLLSVSQIVGSTLELEEVLRRTTREMVRAVEADVGGAWLLDRRRDRFAPVVGYRLSRAVLETVASTPVSPGDRLLAEAQRLHVPVHADDSQADPRFDHPLARLLPHKSILLHPIASKGETIGGIAVVWSRQPHHLSPDELRLVDGIARQAAVAIENAERADDLRRALAHLKAHQDRRVRAQTLRALGEMTSGMAHHLNNLLAASLGWLDLILDEKVPADRAALEVVAQASREAADVVRGVMQFATRPPLVNVVAVDLPSLAREVIEMTRPLWQDAARARGASIDVRLDGGPVPLVAAERSALLEALLSIVHNAIDALPEGGRITVRAWTSGTQVHCAVTDTGVGMSEEVRRRALEPFATTKGPQSRGLGLSVAYGIVRRHRGTLTIGSRPGPGTTITISLPMIVTSSAGAIRAARTSDGKDRTAIDFDLADRLFR